MSFENTEVNKEVIIFHFHCKTFETQCSEFEDILLIQYVTLVELGRVESTNSTTLVMTTLTRVSTSIFGFRKQLFTKLISTERQHVEICKKFPEREKTNLQIKKA